MKTNGREFYSNRQAGFTRSGYLVLAMMLLVPGLIAYGITSYFRLTPETAALRDSVLKSVPIRCDQRLALNLGSFTFGAARTGLAFVDMPPEARKAVKAIRGADVSIYRTAGNVREIDVGKLLATADSAMKRRGWTKVVRVSRDTDLVAVYMPEKSSSRSLKCCVLVWHGEDMVVAGGRADPRPLIELASAQLDQAGF